MAGCGGFGCGSVFTLTPPATLGGAWTETVLYTFTGSDGAGPFGGVIFDASGALYGTTAYGGNLAGCSGFGCGSVVKLTPPATQGGIWTESVLYSFTGISDGAGPFAGVIFDASGALYGTTVYGGNLAGCSGFGCGSVFKLTPPATQGGIWTESVLYSFAGISDGGQPHAGLIFDADGALFGTTVIGGTSGKGVVFKLTPPAVSGAAWTESVLYTFTGSDGANPQAGVILDASGGLYGTTSAGGDLTGCSGVGCGTGFAVFPMATTNSLSVLLLGSGTVTSSPAGINCPTTCSASFAGGTSVTLSESPAGGWNFLGWAGGCSGAAGTCAVTMNANQSVMATFWTNGSNGPPAAATPALGPAPASPAAP